MKKFNLPVYENKLETRNDVKKYLFDILEPLASMIDESTNRVEISSFSSGMHDSISNIEGFLRLLWGLGSVKGLEPNHPWWIRVRKGLTEGVDPTSPHYFGLVNDYDQRIVEMASIGYAMIMNPDCIYQPLTTQEKDNLISWLSQVNDKEAYDCNWKFFRVVVDAAFDTLDIPYKKERMEAYLDSLDSFYIDNGWYKDGNDGSAHADYYVPFAMHFYSLVYAKAMIKKDPERSQKFIDRAILFADEFIHWFSSNGASLPYGRSLTYRFAQVSFWSILATFDNPKVDLGVVKGVILRHLRWWNKQPIFNREGFMTIGYAYEQLTLAENYNASGSVYWALKAFAILLLDENHLFWNIEEKEYPKTKTSIIQEVPKFVIQKDIKHKHILAYNAGQTHTNIHTHVESKYQKFVYSTLFGFSVPKMNKTLRFGAYDNTLAVSEDGQWFKHKETSTTTIIKGNIICTTWKPYSDVVIETTINTAHPHHTRTHKIVTKRNLVVAEAGFALPLSGKANPHITQTDNTIFIHNTEEFVGIANISGYDRLFIEYPVANTNVMNAKTALPTLIKKIKPGTTVLKSFISGDYYNEDSLDMFLNDKERFKI